MIVQCPSCSKRYRVNDDNIPASGGKIRCPACSHSFVVYPDSGNDQGGEVHEPGEKTQVAERPNMEELLKGMQNQGGGAGAGGGGAEPEADKTEVMSGSELPDFGNLFGGGDESPDATTEMNNPMGSPADSLPGMNAETAEDERATQELDANIARESLNQVQEIAESSAPVTGPGGGDDDATQISSPPPDLGEIPGPGQQQRASVPDDPTPPPGHSPADGGGADRGGADPDHDGPWKLRTSFGLTYEFADNESLRDWMMKKKEREELDGYELSADGESFYPLDEFPQFNQGNPGASGGQMASPGSGARRPSSPGSGARRPSSPGSVPGSGQMGAPPNRNPSTPGASGGPPSQPGGRTGSSAGGGSGPMPPAGGGHSPFQTAASPAVGADDKPKQEGSSKEKINPDERFKPPSRDSDLLNWALWGAFGLLFVAAVILALQLGGVISLGDEDEAEQEEIAQEEELPEGIPEEAIDEGDDRTGVSDRAQAEAQRLMESAESDMESNRLASALDRLERAAELDPTRFQLFEMQAEVHEQLGEEEEAQQLREHANELRGESEGVAPPPLPDDGEEG